MGDDPLPTDEECRHLHELVALAFIEIRQLGRAGRAEQAADLANAFHNIPREIYGWGAWSVDITRSTLESYQDKYHHEAYPGRTDYVTLFNAIFPNNE